MKLLTKLIFEFSPLVLFFLSSAIWEGDFIRPTSVLVVATAFSLVLTWWAFHQPALMAIINAMTGIIAGSITLIANDPMYVQMKPTIIGGTYGVIVLIGLLLNKPLFKVLLGGTIHLTEQGWRVLSWMWIFYFAFITVLNEYVWRHYTFYEWAFFKIAVLVPLTVVYALPQIIILKKYRLPVTEPDSGSSWSRRAADAGAAARQPAS
jgi:intracellular septation protein